MLAEESALIKAVCESNDKVAFAKLYDLCSPRAYGLALKILRNEAEADDVLQQAFLSLWQHASEFEEAKGSVMTWLYSFIRNRAIDMLRRKKRENHISIDYDEANPLSNSLPDSAPRPDDILDSKERQTIVFTALKTLPDFQKKVVEAAYFGGLTQQEIADQLKEPLGTIKTRMRLGMMKLTELLKPQQGVLP